MTPADNNKM